MKSKLFLSFFVAAMTLASISSQAQTPGAVAATPDSRGRVRSTTSKASQKNSQVIKQRSRTVNPTSGTTTTENQKYRQSSASNGTSVNNSNSTNYNSNNATNPTTGVGSPTGGQTGKTTARPPRE